MPDSAIFCVHPAPNQQGFFSTELPFMVLNDPAYPWMKVLSKGNNNDNTPFPLPWLALIVVSEDDPHDEKKIVHSELKNETGGTITIIDKTTKGETEKDVFFHYEPSDISLCKANDEVHLVTVPKGILPNKEDRPWLTHCKKIDLSDVDDNIAQKDGFFSVIIANRFPPSKQDRPTKNTVHLVAAHWYDGCDLTKYEFVKMISLYHWDIYSEKANDNKSFVSLVENLSKSSISDGAFKPHYLRTGEKTYSWYHSPILPFNNFKRFDNLNGEEKFTSDGRLIYNYGIFDVSYSAAFNLGKLVTLSHNKEAQQVVNWRKKQKIKEHLEKNKTFFENEKKDINRNLKIILKNMQEEKT